VLDQISATEKGLLGKLRQNILGLKKKKEKQIELNNFGVKKKIKKIICLCVVGVVLPPTSCLPTCLHTWFQSAHQPSKYLNLDLLFSLS